MSGVADSALAGVVAGYAVAVPVGAMAILILDASMRRGFAAGSAAGLGVALADFAYAAVAAFAGSWLVTRIHAAQTPIRIVSALVLVGCGAYLLRSSRRGASASAPDSRPPLALTGQYFAMTLINPLTVSSFAAVVLGLGRRGLVSPQAAVAFAVSAFVASLSWQLVLAVFGSVARHRLSTPARQATGVVGAVLAVALAVRILASG